MRLVVSIVVVFENSSLDYFIGFGQISGEVRVRSAIQVVNIKSLFFMFSILHRRKLLRCLRFYTFFFSVDSGFMKPL